MTRLLVAGLVAAALLASTSCRFERRPDPNASSAGGTPLSVTSGPVRDSIRAVVDAYHAALRVGDGSRVASLSVSGATVMDQEEGVEWRLSPGAGGGGRLPRPLSAEAVGLGWEREGTDFVAWEGSALLVDRYRATVSGEAVPWTAVETFVLERAGEEWLIRHVHRSRGGAAESTVPSRVRGEETEPQEPGS